MICGYNNGIESLSFRAYKTQIILRISYAKGAHYQHTEVSVW